jgi:AAA15 family ATPase/GTPase
MIKKFEVKGFKNFKNTITLDFSHIREYKFNEICIKDNLLNKIIIYGKNAVGKSNLGIAIFDITTHLTDNNISPGLYDYYLNADKLNDYAEFHYVFRLDLSEIDYKYKKNDMKSLIFEEFKVDGEIIFSYNHIKKTGNLDKLKQLVPSLNFEFLGDNVSILRYIVNNSMSNSIILLKRVVHFVDKMLWFRSLDENRFIGYKTVSTDYNKFIFEENHFKEFQLLLNKAGVKEELISIVDPDGQQKLYFKRKMPIPFFKAASNGTRALYTLYYWLTVAKEVSFLFIDEFDAFYHYELAEMIVQLLEDNQNFQVILTSHNTNLLTNKIMRPDCFFILTPENLTSFSNATKRELREGHNLEKLYISGEFDE